MSLTVRDKFGNSEHELLYSLGAFSDEQGIAQLEERDQQTLDQITEVKVCLGQTQQKRIALKETLEKIQIQRQHLSPAFGKFAADSAFAGRNINDCFTIKRAESIDKLYRALVDVAFIHILN